MRILSHQTMPFWNIPLRRRSRIVSQAPFEEERCNEPNQFRLPTNPKDVKLQESEPQSLPSADADIHTVRFFLYHVLTFRGNKVAKRWPQWVLETVSCWKGDGRALRDLDGDLTNLCPMNSGYAQLDNKISPERSPSGDCRTHIGLVLSTKIKKLKEKETRSVKAHEEWIAMRRGSGHLWSQSVADWPDAATIHPSSQFGPLRSGPNIHANAQVHPSRTMPDLRAMYNAHGAFAPTLTRHAQNDPMSGYAIPRGSLTAPLPSNEKSSTRVGYSSSVESPRASVDCSSGTYATDATSLLRSPESVVYGTGKQLLEATRDDISTPYQDFFSGDSSVRSSVEPFHRSNVPPASSQQPLVSQEDVIVQGETNGHSTSQSTIRTMRERSNSASSYATSQHPTSTVYQHDLPNNRSSSSPVYYRGGTLRTVGTLPNRNSMNYPHSGISAPRERPPSVASYVAPVNPYIINATPPGFVCGRSPMLQQGPVPPRTPSRTSSNLSVAHNTRQKPTLRAQIRTVDSFTGPLRSANTASLDDWALSQGENIVSYAREMERLGIRSTHRKAPVRVPLVHGEVAVTFEPSTRILNPKTGLPRMTLMEALTEKEKLDGKRLNTG